MKNGHVLNIIDLLLPCTRCILVLWFGAIKLVALERKKDNWAKVGAQRDGLAAAKLLQQ